MSRQGKLAALASTGVTKAELDLLDGVTSTTAELNITDGVTATAAELNLIHGDTARGTTAVADGDGFLTNDGGTMRMTKVDTLATYMGTKITGGSKVFIASSGAISDAATADFTQFDATAYDSYEFAFLDVLPATDDVELRALTSSDTSSHSYDTGAADYLTPFAGQATEAFGKIFISDGFSNVANEAFSGSIRIWNPHTSFYTIVSPIGGAYTLASGNVTGAQTYSFGFKRKEAAQVNAIRFYFESGNIASGEIVMYGMANGT